MFLSKIFVKKTKPEYFLNKVPNKFSIVKDYGFREYLAVLKHNVNRERKELGLTKIRDICAYIQKYYNGYLQDFLSDIINEPFYKKNWNNLIRESIVLWMCKAKKPLKPDSFILQLINHGIIL
jgi:hypothetical protein